jgi:RNA polymerase sigma factor (sigma-70 family)
MQQTYADAFLSINRFVPRGEGAFRAWLIRLAKRNLLDAVRMLSAEKRGGNRAAVGGGVSGESLAALYEMMEASISSPSGGAARAESKSALQDAIEKLPPEYAKVVRLYDLEGLPVERVAAELTRSVGAVYMLRARAHERLSELMGSPSQFFTNA